MSSNDKQPLFITGQKRTMQDKIIELIEEEFYAHCFHKKDRLIGILVIGQKHANTLANELGVDPDSLHDREFITPYGHIFNYVHKKEELALVVCGIPESLIKSIKTETPYTEIIKSPLENLIEKNTDKIPAKTEYNVPPFWKGKRIDIP